MRISILVNIFRCYSTIDYAIWIRVLPVIEQRAPGAMRLLTCVNLAALLFIQRCDLITQKCGAFEYSLSSMAPFDTD